MTLRQPPASERGIDESLILPAQPRARHRTTGVRVGTVLVGGGAPVVVQSMTNTDTADVDFTVRQCADLARAGSEIVRITVDRDEAAAVRRRTSRSGC